jgi:carboxyl-terminal processing protease
MNNKNGQAYLPLYFGLVLAVGMFIGYRISKNTYGGYSVKANSAYQVQEAKDIIHQYYVDNLSKDSLNNAAITQLIDQLDPHSMYIPPAMQEDAIRDVRGHFKGLGIEYLTFNDTFNLVQVVENSPAAKAGFLVADKIIAVNNKNFTGKNCIADSMRATIRNNSKALSFTINREGKNLTINAVPDLIILSSIDNAALLTKDIGYIKITGFSELTYEDCMKQIEQLLKQGMQHLVFDLRGNGGGLLEEAVQLSDMLVGGQQLLCKTVGAHSKEVNYYTKVDGIFEKEQNKIVVLIDEFTASAAELLAGTLQDLDRGYIIGKRSFGKGLVMQDFNLTNGGIIRLTTSRFYLPSGRCIQKPYSMGNKDNYELEALARHMYANDSTNLTNGKPYKTLKGKVVYGGVGIVPDLVVQNEGLVALHNKEDNNKLVFGFYQYQKNNLNQYATAPEYLKNYRASAADFAWLKNNIKEDSTITQLDGLQEAKILNDLALRITKFKWQKAGYYQALQYSDRAIAAAVNYLNQ